MFDVLEPEDPRQVGRYRIVARIGAGGMGQVFLGRSPGGRPVAVKVVRPELARDGDFRRRFAREVTAARRVNGAYTAGVVDADPDGSPAWLATLYVSGVSLADAVAVHGPWPAASVLALGAGLAEALEAIHAAGVVHRDLKPSNVLLASDGPRVIDFGISTASEATALTHTGMTIGTPGFMSPEQLTGKPIGPASDVFALGAVLAYTAAGVGPFGTGTPHALHFRAVYEQPDLDALPSGLRALVAACLAKEPEQRPTLPELLHRMTAQGQDEPADATLLLTEPGWMPAAVDRLVREKSVTPLPRNATPAPAPAQAPTSAPAVAPIPTPTAQDIPAAADPPLHDALTQTAGQAAQPPAPAAPPTPEAPPFSRRGALVGLAGAIAAAGTAIVVWKTSDGGSGSAADGSPPASTPARVRPVRTTAPHVYAPGQKIWSFRTGDEVHSAPTVANGVVYFGSNDKNLYALDAATGRKRWALDTGNLVYSSAAVVGDMLYVGTEGSGLYAVDAATGKRLWAFNGSDSWPFASPVVAGGVVYAGSEDGYLYAVDAATGKQRWRFRGVKDGLVQSAPTVAGDVVYFCCDDKQLFALDAATGRKLWEFDSGDNFNSSPAVAGGRVYASNGRLYALDAKTGKERWSLTGARYKPPVPGNRALMAPTVVGGVVYVGEEIEYLFALEAATGHKRWTFHAGNSVFPAPVVSAGVVYAGCDDGSLYAVDARTGAKRWAFRTGGALESAAAVAGGVVYVGSKDGSMYAIQT